jgi:hypothetical protein
MITGNQFGFVYIGGVPYNPSKVKRFLEKGAGIKLQDLVIFEAGEDRVLDFIKNAKYMDTVEEKRMVKEFVRASELQMANLRTGELSEQIKKDLAEEGCFITGDGVITNVPAEYKDPAEFSFSEPVTEVKEVTETDIDPALLAAMTPDQRRTMSILLQSSMKIASEFQRIEGEVDVDVLFADTLILTKWIDDNSTGILRATRRFLEK